MKLKKKHEAESSFFASKSSQEWPILRTQRGLQVSHGHHLWICSKPEVTWDSACVALGMVPIKSGNCFHAVLTRIMTLFKFFLIISMVYIQIYPCAQVCSIYLLCKSFRRVICFCKYCIISVCTEHYRRIPPHGKRKESSSRKTKMFPQFQLNS